MQFVRWTGLTGFAGLVLSPNTGIRNSFPTTFNPVNPANPVKEPRWRRSVARGDATMSPATAVVRPASGNRRPVWRVAAGPAPKAVSEANRRISNKGLRISKGRLRFPRHQIVLVLVLEAHPPRPAATPPEEGIFDYRSAFLPRLRVRNTPRPPAAATEIPSRPLP